MAPAEPTTPAGGSGRGAPAAEALAKPRNVLLVLGALALVAVLGYMTLGAKAPWSFLLPYRGEKLVALVLVAVSVSTATVLFQTITFNRILTPSIMGFDALYVLILTGAVWALGGIAVMRMPPVVSFAVTGGAMILASLALFGTLLGQARADIMRMILTGIIFGVLCRSLTGFLQRMIDPNEFAVVQVASYARFTDIETGLLWLAAPLTLGALALAWRMRRALDVVSLGTDTAITLGERPGRRQLQVLVLVALLVSVSTALVGPVAFLGLLVVSLAHAILPTPYHAQLLPAAGLISIIVLVGGQTVLERVLQLATPLSVVVDVLGGIVFLALILKGAAK
ncbi:iron chelate uptake ABC transporter family permease subunit [Marinibacterium profundimaris]|uniref:iron chelate uptake ABC transporter family permease subunit n=1 Tax=Marinibacterium profundimaris TaxID=1679460 RepID=UPI0018EA0123|nr:iron chelate uptake ABC transporter family permease subunit [Marinibacterium profundimaris]